MPEMLSQEIKKKKLEALNIKYLRLPSYNIRKSIPEFINVTFQIIVVSAKSPSNHLILYWLSSALHSDVYGVDVAGAFGNIEDLYICRCSVLWFAPSRRVGKVANRRHPSFFTSFLCCSSIVLYFSRKYQNVAPLSQTSGCISYTLPKESYNMRDISVLLGKTVY